MTESCVSVCQEVETRKQEDAQWRIDSTSLRITKCIPHPLEDDPIGTCHAVVDVDSECYAIGNLFANVLEPLDCAKTDDELMDELQQDLSDEWPRNTGLSLISDDTGESDDDFELGSGPNW